MATLDIPVMATFALMWAAIVPTPGANSLMVMHLALSNGPSHLVRAITGNLAGILLLAFAALLGMTALLAAFPWLRLAVHLFGGAYLIYFGVLLIGRSRRPAKPADMPVPAATAGWKTFGLGFATALSNAQAIVFITSIFALAGILKANIATGLACIAIMIAMNAAYLGFLGWLLLRPAPRRLYVRFRRWIEASVGVLFTLFGLRLIVKQLVRG